MSYSEYFDVIVVGAGAAGMISAGRCAERGKRVLVLEKNNSAGVKLRLTGNGRCNLTNITLRDGFEPFYFDSGKFLYNAFHVFYNEELISLLKRLGVEVKVEDKGRVFPKSDDSADVVKALLWYAQNNGAQVRYVQRVSNIVCETQQVKAVRFADGTLIHANNIILATGGKSYPQTGSSGDGYYMAEKMGHTIVTPRPGLAGLEVDESWMEELSGIGFKDVAASVLLNGKRKKKAAGEMVFTHFGVSGPLMLDISGLVGDLLTESNVVLELDFMPRFNPQELEKYFEELRAKNPRRFCLNVLSGLLPQKFMLYCLKAAGIEPQKRFDMLSKKEISALINMLKGLQLKVKATRPLAEAMVTRGGVSTKEINPKTMESKIIKGLYFCGEVIDVAGVSGGYNLQAAFSTGFVAGNSAG
ncbi:MAG: NAD(P)/FAD-dependent oxidoreductase [Candidatus Omnitrophica bacterium]|nr:NAD(P)/FAD-dependent oxidoreductase [Candidatus Omnitrophota bacterium]MBU4479599.1 NAD(P)/FAD-dependent oxidoreductase [Candidatus Omnitrophota bacterium]MCG2703439.1 NAD(P)/FAD-dependent oxidoreductase [Candidatus Omnitrophota bacterium]MCG2711401.1 NAD(P)/FAD-dependent oxidoreductase [Candidatus Omnitrophota bacterium]